MYNACDPECLRSLIQRLESLERENSRMRRITALFVCGLLVFAAAGAQKESSRGVVECRQFIMKGADGKTRVALSLNPLDEQPGLFFYDKDGLAMSLNKNDLSFHGDVRGGTAPRASFGFDGQNKTRISFWDGQAGHQCSLGVDDNQSPFLRFFDHQKARLEMDLSPNDTDAPSIALSDSKGETRIGISLGARGDGLPMLELQDPKSGGMLEVGVRPDASIGLGIFGKGHSGQIALQLGKDGEPVLKMLDKQGRNVFNMPGGK
jgi:hypothetical protein